MHVQLHSLFQRRWCLSVCILLKIGFAAHDLVHPNAGTCDLASPLLYRRLAASCGCQVLLPQLLQFRLRARQEHAIQVFHAA